MEDSIVEKELKIIPEQIDKDKAMKKLLFLRPEYVSFEDCLCAIIDRINDAEREKEYALKQLKEFNKDDELEKLREELKECRKEASRGFGISEEEQKDIDNWKRKHEAEKHGLKTNEDRMKASGTIGGRYTYHFHPTSIGDIGIIECSCGEKFCFRELY